MIQRTRSSGWFGYDYNMNIYRGCCHGCIYCDSRSDCYGVENFDEVSVKQDALRLIRDELRRKVHRGVVGTGAMSDPYNPFEEELELTRHSLELLDAFGFGVGIATKSPLITRDMDILTSISEHSPALAKITVTTADDKLAGKLEKNAPLPSERIQAAAKLSEAGIYTGILLMPVLPFLEDSEENILSVVKAAKESGARFIYAYFGVTLRDNQRDWFYRQLEKEFPGEGLAERYRKKYQNRYQCLSPDSRRLWKLFTAECEKCRILYRMEDIIYSYKRSCKQRQMSLFDM